MHTLCFLAYWHARARALSLPVSRRAAYNHWSLQERAIESTTRSTVQKAQAQARGQNNVRGARLSRAAGIGLQNRGYLGIARLCRPFSERLLRCDYVRVLVCMFPDCTKAHAHNL